LSLVSGLGASLGYALMTNLSLTDILRIISASFVYIPATLVIIGAAVSIFGLFPKITTPLIWGVYAICLLISYLGKALKLPQFIINISPFAHTPPAPAATIDIKPLIVMIVISIVLMLIGFIAFKRRDLVNN